MALFVDGPASTIDDMTDQDSGLLDVAQSYGVNLSTKLRLAMREIGTDLALWLKKSRPVIGEMWSPGMRVEQIVVNEELKRWETMQALTLVYQDVYFTQVADRFEAKWRGYKEITGTVREGFLAKGLPAVNEPVHRAPPPALVSTTGSGTAGTFYVSVAWVNAAGQQGAASEASSMGLTDGDVMIVAAVDPPPNATGYLVYAGAALDAMYLQSGTAVPVASTYEYLPGEITSGALPCNGQKPEFFRPVARTILRG